MVWVCFFDKHGPMILPALSMVSSSSSPFTPCRALGIHEELPSVAISSYPLDLIPWSSCRSYFILYCPSPRSLRPTSSSIPLRIPIYYGFSIAPTSLRNMCPIQFYFFLFIWISIGFCLVILHIVYSLGWSKWNFTSSMRILAISACYIGCLRSHWM
jgi:hypothetical protein